MSRVLISIIIPNHNKGFIIDRTLNTIFTSPENNDIEVVVVDDGSTDNSLEIIKSFPCKLIALSKNSGASRARNIGARNSKGEFLFFIDSDCLLEADTLLHVRRAIAKYGHDMVIIGGTYTKEPYDKSFFSTFQSIFVSYSELKNTEPDYIATHAMVINHRDFEKIGGFREDFMPILEDVEFSHRAKRMGYKLIMDPLIRVQHFFNFNLFKSLRNAFRKASYWIFYSLQEGDIFADSGTASRELKFNGLVLFMNMILFIFFLYNKEAIFLFLLILFLGINLWVNRRLIISFYEKGLYFTIRAVLYYISLYSFAAVVGSLWGTMMYIIHSSKNRVSRK